MNKIAEHNILIPRPFSKPLLEFLGITNNRKANSTMEYPTGVKCIPRNHVRSPAGRFRAFRAWTRRFLVFPRLLFAGSNLRNVGYIFATSYNSKIVFPGKRLPNFPRSHGMTMVRDNLRASGPSGTWQAAVFKVGIQNFPDHVPSCITYPTFQGQIPAKFI